MAQMTAASIDDLPDSDFAYIEPGGKKDDTGRTVPRSLRHFPIHDAAHVRNALARLSQSPFGDKARPKVEAAARKLGIGEPAQKSSFDMKAGDLTKRKTEQWLAGEISRRVLVVPFGGPLPGGKSGLDLDGEYFDEETDLFGPFPGLRASRWRVMDWHHDDAGVPPKSAGGPASMKGVVIGEVELDEEPSDDGLWADWWIRQGQARADLIARRIALLERRGQPLYGSSQAIFKTKADAEHIVVWPLYRHTATTSPQNTHAVIPALKGWLEDLSPDDLTGDAIKALLVGLGELVPDLRSTFLDEGQSLSLDGGEDAAKAGRVLSAANEALLRQAIDALSGVLSKLKDYAAADAAEDSQ